ncbi:hypothetical protein SGLAM104S_03495 [Streptomyces glaucescens]
MALLLVLGGVFLPGFSEAVMVAIPLVAVFLALNAVIIGVGLADVFTTSGALSSWTDALTDTGGGFGDLAARHCWRFRCWCLACRALRPA